MIVAEVKLWNTRIGAVTIDEDSPYCYFKYDSHFIESGIEVSPITMPLSDITFQFKTLSLASFSGLPGLLSDSLPDRYGNAVINAWLASNGREIESFNIIERLCYIGTRGMGALEFYPNSNKKSDKAEEVEIDQLVLLSNQILNQKESIFTSEVDLKEIIKVGTSAGGARAKAIIAYNEKTGMIKSGQIDAGKGYTYWILKLDGVDQQEETSHTRIEYAYYLMATAAKISMNESKLLKRNGYYHFMTKRFDRIQRQDGRIDKVHMQTLGSLIHGDYNEPGNTSYEEVVQAMNKMGIKRSENEQFFRRMVFNVLARNQDDHVKNISFLMDRQGKWSLSPAYDITYSFNPNGKWTAMHQMVINGKRKEISKEDLLCSARAMGIKGNKALEIIMEINDVVKQFSNYARKADLDEETIKMLSETFIYF